MRLNRRQFLRISAAAAATSATLGAAPASPERPEKRADMPYRTLGRTDVKVSLLGIGGYHIGQWWLPEKDAIAIMRTAVDEGVNFFDNAWEYNDGRSEVRMGKALKDGYRDKVFLMTKHHGREATVAQKHLEDSLRRLDVDMIDLWQFHEISKSDEPQQIYENGAMEYALKAKQEGKIRFIGFTGHTLPAIHLDMIRRGFAWDSLQMPLNVFDHHYRSFEKDVLAVANEKNIGVIGMKAMGAGAIIKANAASPADCLRYVMNLPVATVCSGMDSMDKLKENLATAKAFRPLATEEVSALRERAKPLSADGKYEWYKKW